LTADGDIIGGCNVESSSYGLTCCAERVALYRAVAEGHSSFKALAVATENGGSLCGACRQVVWDLCGDIPIFIADKKGKIEKTSSAKLLPEAFDQNKLK
jgi:cytidine deaminase